MYLSDAAIRGLRWRTTDVLAGRFELVEEIGKGGMGIVHRARDLDTGAVVAVKVLASRATDAARFEREARILARLEHPHIVSYLAHGSTDEDEPYIVMEWLEGETLSAFLARGPVNARDAVAFGARLADALSAAHAIGVVHRDLKPSNVFLHRGELRGAKILDFGIAREDGAQKLLTTTGQIVGTPGYMAPEQARGRRDIDGRADLFSLGCILYRMLTGEPAFEGTNVLSVLAKLVLDDPPRILRLRRNLPESLDRLVTRLISKEAADRPASAAAARDELRRVERELETAAPIAVQSSSPYDEPPPLACVLLSSPTDDASPRLSDEELRRARAEMEATGGNLQELAGGALVVGVWARGSSEDEATGAAACARALASFAPGTSIAVASTRAVSRTGDLVDTAVRLLDGAKAGTILAEEPSGDESDDDRASSTRIVRALRDAGLKLELATTRSHNAPHRAIAERARRSELVAGKYRIVGLLGTGGMGAVYEARNEATLRRVALKVIRDAASTTPELVARFQREAQAVGGIDTPHIVQVLDAGTDPKSGDPFLVMEHLEGEDLHRLLKRIGPLSPGVALRIAAQAARGLAKAHAAGVVHRDIKPANLFLARRDDGGIVVKLLDFGVAKIRPESPLTDDDRTLTRTGSMVGSPAYMSPEQAKGLKEIDGRSDVWSLGAVAFEMLSGRQPHAHVDTIGQLIVAICTEEPVNVQELAPWVPAEAAAIVRDCLRIPPERRFRGTLQLLDALVAALPDGIDLHERMLVAMSVADRQATASREAGDGDTSAFAQTVRLSATPSDAPAAAPNTATVGAQTGGVDAPARTRRRRILMVMGAALAGAGALAVGLRSRENGGNQSENAPGGAEAPATAATSIEPAVPARPEGSQTRPSPKTARVEVAVAPAGVQVAVDGAPTVPVAGRIVLEGEVGTVRRIRLSMSGRTQEHTIVINADGAYPSTLSLEGARLPSRPVRPGGSSMPPTPTATPAASEDIDKDFH